MTHIELHEANGTKVLFPVHGSVFREMPEGAVQCMSSAGFSINPVETFDDICKAIESFDLKPIEIIPPQFAGDAARLKEQPRIEPNIRRIKKPKAQQKPDEKAND